MCGQSEADSAQHECRTDHNGDGQCVDDSQSRSTIAYPPKQALPQSPTRLPRQKHPSPLPLLAIPLAIASFHPALLATRQKVVEPKHVDVNDEQDEARPHDQQPETRDREKQILRMANVLVKGALNDPSPPEFGVVQLNSARDESDQPSKKINPPTLGRNSVER